MRADNYLYSLVFYTELSNIDNLKVVRDIIKDEEVLLYTSRMYDIHNKKINNEDIYYFVFSDYNGGNVSPRYISSKLNNFTKKYKIKWALELIGEYDQDDDYYYFIYDDTKALLDNNKVFVRADLEDDSLAFYASSKDEVINKLSKYIDVNKIMDDINSIDFNNRCSIVSIYNEYSEDEEEIVIYFNTFHHVDSKYFYWN